MEGFTTHFKESFQKEGFTTQLREGFTTEIKESFATSRLLRKGTSTLHFYSLSQ